MYQNGTVMFVSAQGQPIATLLPKLIPGARAVLEHHGLAGLTLERLCSASGVSRMTLHRRDISLDDVVDALLADTAQQYLAAIIPALTRSGTAAERLRAALEATFAVADRHLPLLAGLYARPDSPFHEAASPDLAVTTRGLFTQPLARLLRDGAVDRSLRGVDDPDGAAEALFNVAGWGYVHLRHAQRWPREHAAKAVLELLVPNLLPDRHGFEGSDSRAT